MNDAHELALLSARQMFKKIIRLLAEGDVTEARLVAERGVNVIGRTLEMDKERRRQS